MHQWRRHSIGGAKRSGLGSGKRTTGHTKSRVMLMFRISNHLHPSTFPFRGPCDSTKHPPVWLSYPITCWLRRYRNSVKPSCDLRGLEQFKNGHHHVGEAEVQHHNNKYSSLLPFPHLCFDPNVFHVLSHPNNFHHRYTFLVLTKSASPEG